MNIFERKCIILYLSSKKDSIQRKIGVDSIKALTKSTKDQSNEFVVHVNNEYDYRFDSE